MNKNLVCPQNGLTTEDNHLHSAAQVKSTTVLLFFDKQYNYHVIFVSVFVYEHIACGGFSIK